MHACIQVPLTSVLSIVLIWAYLLTYLLTGASHLRPFHRTHLGIRRVAALRRWDHLGSQLGRCICMYVYVYVSWVAIGQVDKEVGSRVTSVE